MIRKYECTLANIWKGEDPRLNQKCTRCSKERLATPRNSTRFDGIYLKKKWMIKTKYRWFQRKTSNNSSYTCGTKGLKKRRARGLKIRRIDWPTGLKRFPSRLDTRRPFYHRGYLQTRYKSIYPFRLHASGN